MAGIPFIARHFQPLELWVPTEEYADPPLQKLIHSARLQGLRIRTPVQGVMPLNIDGVSVEIVSPEPGRAAAARTYHDLNDSSLVMKISYGAHTFLLTGDIGLHQEHRLLKRPMDLRAHVLKVPHHGKRGSSTAAFLDAVNPDSAIFSCRPYAGRDIPGGVLSRYRDRGVHVFRTDRHGAIQITSNGARLETYTFMPYREFGH
jgi:competence protein ComEC